MFRLVIAALLVYAIYRLWKKAGARPRASAPRQVTAGEMTACAACGTFVLTDEAIRRGGKTYCSTACTQKHDT